MIGFEERLRRPLVRSSSAAGCVCTGASVLIVVSSELLKDRELERLLLRVSLGTSDPKGKLELLPFGAIFSPSSSLISCGVGKISGKTQVPRSEDRIRRKIPADSRADSNGKRVAKPRIPRGTTRPRKNAETTPTSRPWPSPNVVHPSCRPIWTFAAKFDLLATKDSSNGTLTCVLACFE